MYGQFRITDSNSIKQKKKDEEKKMPRSLIQQKLLFK